MRAATGDETETLYIEFLDAFYGAGDRKRSERIAKRLEKALATRPDYHESIRTEEIRSLIAELRGDFATAISSREAEIRKIFELHSMSINTPNWEYILSLYGFGDLSDRLDLLALLYDQQGDLDRAIAVSEESKLFCDAHKIPFDGEEILAELTTARESEKSDRSRATQKRPRGRKTKLLSAKPRNGASGGRRRSA